jgi:hypothetical protein
MAVALANAPVAIVDTQLGLLIAADRAAIIDRLLLRVEMPRRPVCPTAADIPAAGTRGHYMMRRRTSSYYHILVSFVNRTILRMSTPNMLTPTVSVVKGRGVVLL